MNRRGPKWCRENIDYLVTRVCNNAGVSRRLHKRGIREMLLGAIAISEGKPEPMASQLARKIAKRHFEVQWKNVVAADRVKFDAGRRAIVTVAVGELDYFEMLLPAMQRYANRVEAELIVVRNKTQDWPLLEKFRVNRIAKQFEQTLFVDADVWIREDAPNLFERQRPGRVLIHNDWERLRSTKWLDAESTQLFSSQRINRGPLTRCLNTGVVVCDRSTADIWKPPQRKFSPTHCAEQIFVDHQIGERFDALPTELNCQHWMPGFSEEWKSSPIVHLANCRNRKKWLRTFAANELNLTT